MASPLLGLLSGLTTGASSRWQALLDEERKTKQREQDLVATSLEKRLEEDESLTPEDQVNLMRQALTLRGMKTNEIEPILQASGYFRNLLAEKERMKPGIAPAISTTFNLPPIPGVPETAGQRVDFSIPESPFGPMPMRTTGEIKFERELPMVQRKAEAVAQAQREATRAATTGSIEDKIAIMQQYQGTDLEDEVRYMLQMAPRTKTGIATVLPGPGMRGTDLKKFFPDATDIEDPKLYKMIVGPDKLPIAYYPSEEATVSGKAVAGSEVISRFQTDLMNNPVNPNQMYVPIRFQTGGDYKGVVPETELGTYSTRNNVRITTNAAGEVIAVPVTETTATQRTMPGGGPIAQAGGPLGQIPSMPVRMPAAASQAPPFTPRVIGTRPLTKEEVTSVNAAKEGVDKMNQLLEMLRKDPNQVLKAAIPGVRRILAPTWTRYTGELADLVTRVRTGAALNKEEEVFYANQLPGAADIAAQSFNFDKNAVENAINLHRDYFQRVVDQYEKRSAKPGAFGTMPTPAKPGTKRSLESFERR